MFELTDDPVSLIYAKSPEYNATSAYYIEGYVLIRKLAIDKSVTIHYTYDKITWLTSQGRYMTDSKDNFEVWYFKTPNTYNYNSCNFAICYRVGNNEFWDNNHGTNYDLKWYSPTKVLNNCVVILDKTFKSSNTLCGSILLKNLAYQKQVKVRYSFNKWKTISEVDATYSCRFSSSHEKWTFKVPLSQPCKIYFIVCYIVNNITYIDQKFGTYYIL